MSAQDYYNPGGSAPAPSKPIPVPQQNNQQPPAPPQQQQQTPPYPLYDGPPPPYSLTEDQRPHSQPPPLQRPDSSQQQQYRPTRLSSEYRPQPQQPQPHRYDSSPPEKRPHPPYDDYRRDDRPPMQYGQHSGHNVHFDNRPSSNSSKYPPPGNQYQSIYRGRKDEYDNRYYDEDYERRNRTRSRSRSRDRDREPRRRHVERKKSSGVNTFLGAGGGAILGDMIFPGLGTIGGALLGGVGGHEYGKARDKTHHERAPGSGRRPRRYSDDDADYRRRKY